MEPENLLECSKCHHKWKLRGTSLPKVCPKCKTKKWMGEATGETPVADQITKDFPEAFEKEKTPEPAEQKEPDTSWQATNPLLLKDETTQQVIIDQITYYEADPLAGLPRIGLLKRKPIEEKAVEAAKNPVKAKAHDMVDGLFQLFEGVGSQP